MRAIVLVITLAGCRSELMPAPDLAAIPVDLSARDVAASVPVDLASYDQFSSDMDICDLQHQNGSCPPGYTCCAFTCWGGGPVDWCYPSGPIHGCPVC
jgi:hypothetical protein